MKVRMVRLRMILSAALGIPGKLRLLHRLKRVEGQVIGLAACGADSPLGCGSVMDARSPHVQWRMHHEARRYVIFCPWCVSRYDQKYPGRKVPGVAKGA